MISSVHHVVSSQPIHADLHAARQRTLVDTADVRAWADVQGGGLADIDALDLTIWGGHAFQAIRSVKGRVRYRLGTPPKLR